MWQPARVAAYAGPFLSLTACRWRSFAGKLTSRASARAYGFLRRFGRVHDDGVVGAIWQWLLAHRVDPTREAIEELLASATQLPF